MRVIRDMSWSRQGISLLWGAEALARIAAPGDVRSLRQLHELARDWPDTLPAAGGRALVVAGVEGCLDLIEPSEAELWLERDLRDVLYSFQDHYHEQRALVLWLSTGKRIHAEAARDAYLWQCAPPQGAGQIEIGRALWGGAEADARRIVTADDPQADPDGPAWVGLYQRRIS